MDVFVAALYLPSRGLAALGKASVPMAVRLTVLSGFLLPDSVPGKYREALAATLPGSVFVRFETAIGSLAAGDVLALTAEPGGRLRIELNGSTIGVGDTAAVVPAVLTAWSDGGDWHAKLRKIIDKHRC
jgi:hypothetical protein